MLINNGATYNNITNKKGESPLYLAASYGHLEVLKLLIEKYDAIFTTRNHKHISPLEVSLFMNKFECFDFLIEQHIKK